MNDGVCGSYSEHETFQRPINQKDKRAKELLEKKGEQEKGLIVEMVSLNSKMGHLVQRALKGISGSGFIHTTRVYLICGQQICKCSFSKDTNQASPKRLKNMLIKAHLKQLCKMYYL